MSKAITHIANALGRPLHVFYCTNQMTLDEIDLAFGIKAGASKLGGLSASVSADTKMVMKRDTRIRYIRIPQKDFGKVLAVGAIYVTVFVENDPESGNYLNISQNFHIPSNRSFIVTASYNMKFQMYGANIWVDEQGINHRE